MLMPCPNASQIIPPLPPFKCPPDLTGIFQGGRWSRRRASSGGPQLWPAPPGPGSVSVLDVGHQLLDGELLVGDGFFHQVADGDDAQHVVVGADDG